MKKQLLLLVLILLPMMASAFTGEAVIDGIKYYIVTKGQTAEVRANSYTGDIVIPETIEYEGVTCNVTSIGIRAFYECSSLTSVIIPNSVTTIGRESFSGCSSLASITIPNSVTSIGGSIFKSCTSLTSVTIGSSVTSVGEYAFYGCTSLTSVIIGTSVTSIGDYAFYYCTNLTSITIPNSVMTIGKSVFQLCTSLISVTIGSSVTSIGELAFRECTSLTSVTIGSSVTSIGNLAFQYCFSLTSVTIPNSVIMIDYGAFYGCGLTSVIIPNSVTNIGGYAFRDCRSLTSVTMGSSVKSIDSGAFSYCVELTDLYCYAENVPSTSSDAFVNSEISYATLHVPDGSVIEYTGSYPWGLFGTIVGLEGGGETPKCATPTIYYNDGELSYKSETEGATFQYTITDTDIQSGNGDKIQLNVTYHISVYATKSGYQNSDVAEATLCWIEVDPQKEGITEETATDAKQLKAMPVLIQANDGQISVEGAPEGTKVAVYDASGMEMGTAISRGGTTLIPAPSASGSIIIVKIGEKVVKVKVKQ